MIYELRVYHCMPGQLPALLERFETVTCRLFMKHGMEQAGYWTATDEPASDLIYILKWDSLVDRDEKFATFRVDPEWVEARVKEAETGRIVESVTSRMLTPTVFSALQ